MLKSCKIEIQVENGVRHVWCKKQGGCGMSEMRGANWERMADLERRVVALEERLRRALWCGDFARGDREGELIARYGEAVDKTVAAQILGVTRATVYTMLEDGRIQGACEGRKVDVRSISRYLSSPQRGSGTAVRRARKGKEGGHECA